MRYTLKKISLSTLLFVAAVLIITRIDAFVNYDFYRHGLIFSYEYYNEWQIWYFFLWQFTVLTISLYSGSWKMFISLEIFVNFSMQDLVFFAVWVGGFPQKDWVWMPYYEIFGFWSTQNQIMLSWLGVFLIAFIFVVPFGKLFSEKNTANRTDKKKRKLQ